MVDIAYPKSRIWCIRGTDTPYLPCWIRRIGCQNILYVPRTHIPNQASTHVPQDRWSKDQHVELVNVIGDPGKGILTRNMASKLTTASASECLFADFFSKMDPKKVSKVLKQPGWVNAMQEELNQFCRNKVWTLVPLPHGKTAIGSKCVFRNKKDEHGITTKKARLVAQIFRMDVKSAFLNGKLKQEVYVKLPPGFESSEFPDYVSNPKESHLTTVKRILRYLKGTPSLGLYYPKCLGFDLKGYSDSDYSVAMSSANVEYVAAARCCATLLLSDHEMVQESDDEEVFAAREDMDKDTQADEEVHPKLKKYNNILPLTERQLVKYLRKVSQALFNKLTNDQWAKHEEAAVSYAGLKASIEGYYEENDAVKDDPALNKKVIEATEAHQEFNCSYLSKTLTSKD
nr:retrovirus-related Pol polyprotein from transposon TNT 1-94 [Tanacetum cinerariifolium]